MKVLVVTPSYPTDEQPIAGTFVREHALAAASAGADVGVLHLARGRPGVAHSADGGLPYWRSGFSGVSRAAASAGLLVAALRGLHAVDRNGFGFDLVHAHFFIAAVPLSVLTRRPLVTTEHWSIFLPDDPATLSPLAVRAARFAFRRSCAVLPVSESLRTSLVAHGVRARFRVIPNAIDTTLFHPALAQRRSGHSQLLTVGRLAPEKGLDTLLDAIALLRRQGREPRLEVLGDGEQRAPLEAHAARLELRDVRFLGHQPKEVVAERMRSADLFVLPSRFESNGVAVIEALASGLPVVGSAIPSFRELVDDECGLLSEPDSPDALAAAIRTALGRCESFDRRAIATRASRKFSREAVGRSLVEVYSQCLAAAD